MRRTCLVLAILLPTLAFAQSADELFEAADAAFQAGEYPRAESLYLDAIDAGAATPAAYYNLGCVYFAEKKLGEAVLAFERARLYSPRFADLLHNLHLIRTQFLADQDIVKAREEGAAHAVLRIVRILTVNEWLALCAALFWVTIGALWFRMFVASPLFRLLLLYGFLTLGFLLLGVGFLTAEALHLSRPGTRAVVLAQELLVQQSPGGQRRTLFRLHPGVEVRVEERRGDWSFVRLPNGAAGWAGDDSLGLINPADYRSTRAFRKYDISQRKETVIDGQEESGNHTTLGPGAREAGRLE